MFWKPEVNLLVLLYVGGVWLVCILFKIDGTVDPLCSCLRKTKGRSANPLSEHWRTKSNTAVPSAFGKLQAWVFAVCLHNKTLEQLRKAARIPLLSTLCSRSKGEHCLRRTDKKTKSKWKDLKKPNSLALLSSWAEGEFANILESSCIQTLELQSTARVTKRTKGLRHGKILTIPAFTWALSFTQHICYYFYL